jgi:MFS family permease
MLLTVLLATPFLAQADATIANVATPAIRAGLGASGAAAELVIGGCLIVYAVLLITGARLAQTHGYRRLFLLGAAVFGTVALACGLGTESGHADRRAGGTGRRGRDDVPADPDRHSAELLR